MSNWVLNAVRITGNLYRVDMRGDLVQHGVDPIMTPKIEGRAVAMVDEKTLQAMRDELTAVLTGRPSLPPIEDINPEDLA